MYCSAKKIFFFYMKNKAAWGNETDNVQYFAVQLLLVDMNSVASV